MSSVHHGGYILTSPAIMSVGQIQQRDLFDDDVDEEDNPRPAAAVSDVNNSNVSALSNTALKNSNTSSSSQSSRSSCSANGCRWQYVVTIILLTMVNLINYMDRFSVAGLCLHFFNILPVQIFV